jgi:phenylacetate-coenzyme A ligase PaaK-like adenylate-forming protein
LTQESKIFDIKSNTDFNELALKIFHYQSKNVSIYQKYLSHLKIDPLSIKDIHSIPCLPIRFFKSYKIININMEHERIFKSSGTTDSIKSKHYIASLALYKKSFINSFKEIYGNIKDYTILALLPSYIEQGDSSLIFMVNELLKISSKNSQYITNSSSEFEQLATKFKHDKTILIGVSYALLDLCQEKTYDLSNWIVMETGGMKGRRKELTREELHQILKKAFNLKSIHSEYGMTELLSQAYSIKDSYFNPPPWMKILIREINDPFQYCMDDKTGGINVIDLANINSCSFLATDDLGKTNENGFKVIGRFDQSDTRGCNQLNTLF